MTTGQWLMGCDAEPVDDGSSTGVGGLDRHSTLAFGSLRIQPPSINRLNGIFLQPTD